MYNNSYDTSGKIIDEIDIFHGSGDNWKKDTFDSLTAKYTGKSIEYDLVGLLKLEAGIQQDLNKDGFTGEKITKIITGNKIASNGEFFPGLFESASGGYYFDDSGTMSPGSDIHNNSRLLKANTVNKHVFEHKPIGALHHKDEKSEVYYHDENENWFRDKFDKVGIYESTESINYSELLNLETLHDNDLNKDSWVGDRIESQIASDGNGLGLYKTMSGAYVTDKNGLQIGNSPVNPTIFTEQISSKGYINTSLYDFKYTPSGVVSFEEGGTGVYYREVSSNGDSQWKKDSFNDKGIYQQTDLLNISQVLNDEAKYDLDISGNLVIGDTIVEVFGSDISKTNSEEKSKLYKTESGSYILDYAGNNVGDTPEDPILLTNETLRKGNVTKSLYSFKYEPKGSIVNLNGDGNVYYQDASGNWFKDIFNERGVFKETKSLTFNELLVDETKHSVDLNNDDSIGDTITSIIVESANLGVYKTVSNSFLIDKSGLDIGDSSVSPILLVKQTVSRGNTTTSLYDFSNTPTGVLSFKDGSGVGVYYKNSGGAWKRDNFDNDGVFQITDSLTLSEMLNDEAIYDVDLDGDGKVGDTISKEIQSSSKLDFTVKYSLKHDYENDSHLLGWQPEFTIDPSKGLIYSNANFLNANGNEYNFEVNAETSDGKQLKKDFTIKIKNEDLKLSNFATDSKESLHEPFTVLSKNKDEFVLGYLSLDDEWTGVSAKVFDLEGNAKTSPFQINTNENGKQQDLKIVNISDGLYAAAYSSGTGAYSAIDSNYGGVALQLFRNDGSLIGSEQKVNDNTLKNEQLSAISSLDNGNFVISYHTENGYNQEFNPQESKKYFQIYSSEGTRIGNNIEITDSSGGTQSFILSKNDGGFSIVSEKQEWVTLSNGSNSFRGERYKISNYDAQGNFIDQKDLLIDNDISGLIRTRTVSNSDILLPTDKVLLAYTSERQ